VIGGNKGENNGKAYKKKIYYINKIFIHVPHQAYFIGASSKACTKTTQQENNIPKNPWHQQALMERYSTRR
jgi:hypothetical protein